MLIRFMGPGCVRRIVGGVEFSRAVGMVQEVDEALGEALVMTGEFDYAGPPPDDSAEDTSGGFEVEAWVEEIDEELNEEEDPLLSGYLGEMIDPIESDYEEQDETEITSGLVKRG